MTKSRWLLLFLSLLVLVSPRIGQSQISGSALNWFPGVASIASLNGGYSFRFYGQDFAHFPSGINNQIAGVGVFTADGNGNITDGSLAYNDGGQTTPCRGSLSSFNGTRGTRTRARGSASRGTLEAVAGRICCLTASVMCVNWRLAF
jgi:hypothetical protein